MLLRIVADSITSSFNNGIACRQTSDKFLIFTKETNKLKFISLLNIIDDTIKIKTKEMAKLNASIYQGCDDLESAIDKAIFTMLAKNSSINFYTDTLYNAKRFESELEYHFNQALKSNEFLLYLQPKINIETNQIIGAEALSRWNYKDTILGPRSFIKLLEENHKIKDLDFYIFKKVCEFQRKSIDNNLNVYPISINASRALENFKQYISTLETIRLIYNLPSSLFELRLLKE